MEWNGMEGEGRGSPQHREILRRLTERLGPDGCSILPARHMVFCSFHAPFAYYFQLAIIRTMAEQPEQQEVAQALIVFAIFLA